MPANKENIRSDLAKVDAHVIQPHEYDDAPELTDEQIASAVLTRAAGRSSVPDVSVELKLAPDVVDLYKATGPEWQLRMQDDLAEAAKRLKVS